MNKYGPGAYSAITKIRPTGVPEGINPVATALVGTNVIVQWQAFESKGRTITAYEVVFELADDINFVEIPLFCNGRDANVVKTRTCYVPMLVFRLSPFYLIQNELIVAKVRAYNEKGWGPYNNENTNGLRVITEPHTMNTPQRASQTGPTQIEVSWSSLSTPNDGGSEVKSYHLQYDNGTSATTWLDVVGLTPDSLLTSYTVSTDILTGEEYAFRVRARNIFGWGPYSLVAYIKAAREPAAPAAPTTSVDPVTGGIAISWVAPDARGDTITAYKI